MGEVSVNACDCTGKGYHLRGVIQCYYHQDYRISAQACAVSASRPAIRCVLIMLLHLVNIRGAMAGTLRGDRSFYRSILQRSSD